MVTLNLIGLISGKYRSLPEKIHADLDGEL
jgi:hypothetical protein